MIGITKPQLVRYGLCLMVAMAHARGTRHRYGGNKANGREYEFGRVSLSSSSSSHGVLEDTVDEDRRLEDFLEVDVFSMSMSMASGPRQTVANLTPVPQSSSSPADESGPSSDLVVIEKQSSIPCTGTTSTAVVFTIEVELAEGKTEFARDLENAFTDALSNRSYTMCDPRRRLKRPPKTRKLEDAVLLSPVVVIETGQTCYATSALSSSCQTASVAMEAYGTEDREAIVASVDLIITDDVTFDGELMVHGIVDVRLVEDTSDGGSSVAASTSSAASSGTVKSSQTVMAVILSVAAVTLVVAIILRQGAKRRRHFAYGPTMEEIYGESHCLGIRSLEQMEHSSDYDTHYTESIYPNAASF